ncbi:MAG: hypothetical protein WA081_09760 [Desulfosalsimonadaceae bacterium]
MTTIPKPRFEKKRLETLYRQSNIGFSGNLAVALCIGFLFWQKFQSLFILFWLLAMLAVLFWRFRITRGFKTADRKTISPKIWFLRYGICMALTGILWGSFGIYADFTASQLYLSITLITLSGIVAAAVATTAASIPTFLVFSIPILLPFGMLLMFSGEFEKTILGILVVLYLGVTTQAARRLNNVIMESLTYRYEKIQLLNDLQNEKKQVMGLNKQLERDIEKRKLTEKEKERLIAELQKALGEVKTLSGLIPICAHCKKVRDDKGYWNQIESYIHERSDADFSHSICPACAKILYPDIEI